MSEYIGQDNNHNENEHDWTLYILGLIIMVIFLLSSCRTIEYVPVEKIVTKDSIVIQKEYDSVEIKVKEYVDGGIQYRDSIIFRYKLRCDTIYKTERDSVPYPVPVVKEVERSLNGYEKTMIRLGWCFIALLVAICGWKFAKWYFKK
jgi:hypothetical protein